MLPEIENVEELKKYLEEQGLVEDIDYEINESVEYIEF